MALSLTTAGAAVGQLVVTPIAAYLLVNNGWQSAYRAEAVFMGLLVFPLVVLLLRNAPAESKDVSERVLSGQRTPLRAAIRHATWWQLLMGVFACGFTMSFASVHFVAFAADMGMGEETAAGALGISGLFSIVGAVALANFWNTAKSLANAAASYPRGAPPIAANVGSLKNSAAARLPPTDFV